MNSSREDKITPDMTVRDVNMKYPQAMAVFDKYGIAGCGGKYGPPESLNFFAQAHKVDCLQLIDDLEKAIQGIPVETVVVGAENVKEENTLYRGYVKAAIVFALTGGATWGTLILFLNVFRGRFSMMNLALAQAHANIQVYGWVGLFIMGFAYHAIPRFKNTPLRLGETAPLSLILVITSLAIRFVAQPLLQEGPLFGGLLISSGILLLLGYASFLVSMIFTIRNAELETEFYEKFIVASLVWGFVSVLLNIDAVLSMVGFNVPLIQPDIDEILRHIQFYGFIAMMIIGVSYRLLPGFLGVESANPVLARWVFVTFNIGILLWIFAEVSGFQILLIAASGLELLAVLIAIVSLNLFQAQRAAVEISGESPYFEWYIRLAYIWLIAAISLMIGGAIFEIVSMSTQTHMFKDAYRHALAMGFVTTILMGVAQRVLPVWEGKTIHSSTLMSRVFFLLLLGNIIRILPQTFGGSVGNVDRFLIACGGFLQFSTVLLFSYNVWKTLNVEEDPIIETVKGEDHVTTAEPARSAATFDSKTKVFEILHEHPGAKEVLGNLGIKGLPGGESESTIPKFLTLERICRSSNVEINSAIAALEDYIRRDG
jgi:hypothetical protein